MPLKRFLFDGTNLNKSRKAIGKYAFHSKSIDNKFKQNWTVNHGTQYYQARGISRDFTKEPEEKTEDLKHLLILLTKKEKSERKSRIKKEEKQKVDILITESSNVNFIK